MQTKEEMLKQMRAEQARKSKKDPDEFRCPQVKEKERLELYFKVLPPLEEGEACATGVSSRKYSLWYYENGAHYINKNREECPRIHDNGECDMCQLGFDLLGETEDKELRKTISNKHLARAQYGINVYFLNIAKNPENVRGKVMWYNAQRTVWERMNNCMMNDDPGDENDPKACGVFFHPWDKHGTYTFKLVATHKGEFNDYSESIFLPKTQGPLVADKSGEPDKKAIQAILDKRHDIAAKFKARDPKKLKKLTEEIKASSQGDDSDEQEGVEKIPGVQKGVPKTSMPKPSLPKKPAEKKPEPEDDLTEPPHEELEESKANHEPAEEKVEEKAEEKPEPDPEPETKPAKPESKDEEPVDDDEELKQIMNEIKAEKTKKK